MKSRKWSKEEDDFLKANMDSMTVPEMAEKLDRTIPSVQLHLNSKLGFKKLRPKSSFDSQIKGWQVGERHNRLTLEDAWVESKYGQRISIGLWLCDCGSKIKCRLTGVRTNHTKSCGCLRSEKAAERAATLCLSHGMSNHPLYKLYNGMISRCTYPNQKRYCDYGGRGIKVCDEWVNSFEAFRDWAIKNGWRKELTIDRKDNSGNYEPNNCRFVTSIEQANNKRSNRILAAFGESKTVAEWARDPRCHTTYHNIIERIDKLGWSNEVAINTPKRKINKIK